MLDLARQIAERQSGASTVARRIRPLAHLSKKPKLRKLWPFNRLEFEVPLPNAQEFERSGLENARHLCKIWPHSGIDSGPMTPTRARRSRKSEESHANQVDLAASRGARMGL